MGTNDLPGGAPAATGDIVGAARENAALQRLQDLDRPPGKLAELWPVIVHLIGSLPATVRDMAQERRRLLERIGLRDAEIAELHRQLGERDAELEQLRATASRGRYSMHRPTEPHPRLPPARSTVVEEDADEISDLDVFAISEEVVEQATEAATQVAKRLLDERLGKKGPTR